MGNREFGLLSPNPVPLVNYNDPKRNEEYIKEKIKVNDDYYLENYIEKIKELLKFKLINFNNEFVENIMQNKSKLIIASAGVQSQGKSYFLNWHFNRLDIIEDIENRTLYFNNPNFENGIPGVDFLGIESNYNTYQEENQNIDFSSTFSDLYLYHIYHSKVKTCEICMLSMKALHLLKLNYLNLYYSQIPKL